MPLASPPADDPPSSAKVASGLITVHSAVEWAESNKSKFAQIAKDVNLQPDVFDYATWSFLDFTTSRTWSDVGSLDEARSIGWDEKVDSIEQGYKVVFEDLKKLGIIPA